MFLVANHVISGASVAIFAVSVTEGQLLAGWLVTSPLGGPVKVDGRRLSHAGHPPFLAEERGREGGDFCGLF